MTSFYLLFVLFTSYQTVQCFLFDLSIQCFTNQNQNRKSTLKIYSHSKSQEGDPIRAALGKRPSLHPVTINAISNALLIRSKAYKNIYNSDNIDKSMAMELLQVQPKYDIKPIDIAMMGGKIAADAIEKRQQATKMELTDTMKTSTMLLKENECQVIAGRILGVIMRFQELENQLFKCVRNVPWVQKFNAYDTFGLLSMESQSMSFELADRMIMDPLFRLNRAECLLAIFLIQVEIPKLKLLNETIVGGPESLDFIDQDRLDVLQTL